MLSYKEYTNIRAVRKAWNKLIPENSRRIYQSFSFNQILYSRVIHSVHGLTHRLKYGNKPIFVVAYENGSAKCIAPIMVFNKPEKVIRMLGYNTNAGYLDFIYEDSKYVAPTVEHIKSKYPEHVLEFTFVHETSKLCSMGERIQEFANYAITLHGHDTWFRGLSKSTRQNIRTAYNRLKTDGHEYSIEVYHAHELNLEKKISRVNDIYWRRRVIWTGKESEYSRYNRMVFPKRDAIYQSLRKKENTVLVVLNIDDREAAFFMGLQYENGICIPRLAIDVEYSRYSPGLVLINEYLKSVQIDGQYTFDLCRGEEGYKTALNGEKTFSYKVVIE